mgnify:CR=1 FL=1
MSLWSVYLLRDEQNSLYTGITTDVARRCQEHRAGGPKAAKYTRSKKDLKLVYSCAVGSRSLASRVEYRLKKLSKPDKEALVLRSPGADCLLALLEITVEQLGGNTV